jgi:hypothetical protein
MATSGRHTITNISEEGELGIETTSARGILWQHLYRRSSEMKTIRDNYITNCEQLREDLVQKINDHITDVKEDYEIFTRQAGNIYTDCERFANQQQLANAHNCLLVENHLHENNSGLELVTNLHCEAVRPLFTIKSTQ